MKIETSRQFTRHIDELKKKHEAALEQARAEMESAIAAERAYQIGERDKAVAHEKKQNQTEKEKDLWQQRMEHESELAD